MMVERSEDGSKHEFALGDLLEVSAQDSYHNSVP